MSCHSRCSACDSEGTCTSCWSSERSTDNFCFSEVVGCSECDELKCTNCEAGKILYTDVYTCLDKIPTDECMNENYQKVGDSSQTEGYRCDEFVLLCTMENCAECPEDQLDSCTECSPGFYLLDWSSQPKNIQNKNQLECVSSS